MQRCVIVTVLAPPDPANDVHGVYQRLRLFTRAMARLPAAIEMVHLVPHAGLGPRAEAAASLVGSRFWGCPVTVRLLPLDLAPRAPLKALAAPFSLAPRGDFRPFLGRAARAGLTGILSESPALIFAHRLPAMEMLRGLTPKGAPILFDLDDVEHLVKQRAAAHSGGWRARLETPALRRAERRAIATARATFICSEHDRAELAREGFDTARVVVAPNAVDCPDAVTPPPRRGPVLFIGNYGHAPNAEAAERLVARIFPLVKARAPEVELIIAGRHADRIPSFGKASPGVSFAGFVDDVPALYRRARLVCCPLENGGGTRIKLIEAAAHSRPIVATAMAAEGLALRHGEHLLIAENDAAIAEAVLALLADDARAAALAEAARAEAGRLYALPAITEQIVAAARAALDPDVAAHEPHGKQPPSDDARAARVTARTRPAPANEAAS